LLALIGMVAAAWVDPMGRVLPMAAAHLGAIVIVAGIGGVLWVSQVFEDAGTTTKPFHVSSVLVMDGPFRVSRNPMYLGMVVILVGVGLALRSLLPFVVVPMFALAIQWRFIVAEERALERDFGEAYRDYRETVRRWL
jgi:protein-S-isoprenylcysteine O-methyltransferase Ste14